MRKQLRQRFRQQTNIKLAQSAIYNVGQDKSIIHQLGDLLDQETSTNDHDGFLFGDNIISMQNNSNHKNRMYNYRKTDVFPVTNIPHAPANNNISNKIRVNAIASSVNMLKSYNNRGEFQYPLNSKLGHPLTSKNRHEQKNINNDQLHARPSFSYKNIFNDLQQKQKRKSYNRDYHVAAVHETSKQQSNYYAKVKYDYNRSIIVKCKQFLTQFVFERCQHCNQLKSELFRNNFVCRSRECRLQSFNEQFQTFPIIAALYEIQHPSATNQQLQQLRKKVQQELNKVQIWRTTLLNLQYDIQSIVQIRKQSLKYNKNQLNSFKTLLSSAKLKNHTSQINSQIRSLQIKLQSLQLRDQYQQMKKWHKISIQKYRNSKQLQQMLNKCMPLCLKTITSQLVQQIADVSDNFNSSKAIVNVSEFLTYNFFGNIKSIILNIDGSIQVKRENLLLVENLKELKLQFQSRKTSRQLKQLFSILPNADYVDLTFDYKLHSHVSSEAFPLLSKTCTLANKSLTVNLINARTQIFEDISQMSRTIKQKLCILIAIHMNPHLPKTQWPQHCISQQFGTRTLKSIIKNLGNQIIKINLQLPLLFKSEEISQCVLNGDYCKLVEFKLQSSLQEKSNNNESQRLQRLLQTISNKKKLLVAHILNQKRQSSHVLNRNWSLAQSVYQVLL